MDSKRCERFWSVAGALVTLLGAVGIVFVLRARTDHVSGKLCLDSASVELHDPKIPEFKFPTTTLSAIEVAQATSVKVTPGLEGAPRKAVSASLTEPSEIVGLIIGDSKAPVGPRIEHLEWLRSEGCPASCTATVRVTAVEARPGSVGVEYAWPERCSQCTSDVLLVLARADSETALELVPSQGSGRRYTLAGPERTVVFKVPGGAKQRLVLSFSEAKGPLALYGDLQGSSLVGTRVKGTLTASALVSAELRSGGFRVDAESITTNVSVDQAASCFAVEFETATATQIQLNGVTWPTLRDRFDSFTGLVSGVSAIAGSILFGLGRLMCGRKKKGKTSRRKDKIHRKKSKTSRRKDKTHRKTNKDIPDSDRKDPAE